MSCSGAPHRCASLDGDADRLVYFRPGGSGGNALQLFDGDRIAVLTALLLRDLIRQLPSDAGPPPPRVCGPVCALACPNGTPTRMLRKTPA